MKSKKELLIKFAPLIEQTKQTPELVLQVPRDTMLKYIYYLGLAGEIELFKTLSKLAAQKYGLGILDELELLITDQESPSNLDNLKQA